MKVLVGIPSFRRPEMLRQLLDSLALQELDAGLGVEIFVADNDPAECAALTLCEELATNFALPLSATLVSEPGLAAVRNRLLDEAERRGSDLLAMVDDDEFVSSGWLAALVAACVKYDAAVVGGPVLYDFAEPASAALSGSGAFPLKRRPSGRLPMIEASGNLLLDCAALARLGWPRFDPRFALTGGEDKEYMTRLKAAGLTFAWADDAIAREHVPPARMTIRSILRRAYGIGGSDLRIDALHGKRWATALHLIKSVGALASAIPLAPLLLLEGARLRLLRRYARALGRIAAAAGARSARYGG